jgi:hypothetical protein
MNKPTTATTGVATPRAVPVPLEPTDRALPRLETALEPPTGARTSRIGAVLILAAFSAAVGLGAYGLTQPPAAERHCRIEVYADGSAEPLCQAGYQPTRPIDQWPIVRVEA